MRELTLTLRAPTDNELIEHLECVVDSLICGYNSANDPDCTYDLHNVPEETKKEQA